MGGGEAGTVSVVTRVMAKGSMVNFEMKVVVDPGVVMAQVGCVEASAQPMDDVRAAKHTFDAWFDEALNDASIPALNKPAAINVA